MPLADLVMLMRWQKQSRSLLLMMHLSAQVLAYLWMEGDMQCVQDKIFVLKYTFLPQLEYNLDQSNYDYVKL